MDSNEIFFKYTTSVEKLIVRIERSIKIQNCFEYDKETSRTIYINVSDTLHDLKVLIASMEIILEDEKKKLKQSQVSYNKKKKNYLLIVTNFKS